MKKYISMLLMAATVLCVMPVITRADDETEITDSVTAQEDLIIEEKDITEFVCETKPEEGYEKEYYEEQVSCEISSDTFYVSADALNIRQQPDDSSSILGRLCFSDEIEVVSYQDNSTDGSLWAEILLEEGTGYVNANYISSEKREYSDSDLLVLAKILCGECQTASDEEQRLVGSVFLNRVASDDFPDTFEGVATDRRFGIQYASWYDGNAHREIQESNWNNAKWLLENGSILPDYVLFQSRGKQGKVYLKTDYHYYCY